MIHASRSAGIAAVASAGGVSTGTPAEVAAAILDTWQISPRITLRLRRSAAAPSFSGDAMTDAVANAPRAAMMYLPDIMPTVFPEPTFDATSSGTRLPKMFGFDDDGNEWGIDHNSPPTSYMKRTPAGTWSNEAGDGNFNLLSTSGWRVANGVFLVRSLTTSSQVYRVVTTTGSPVATLVVDVTDSGDPADSVVAQYGVSVGHGDAMGVVVMVSYASDGGANTNRGVRVSADYGATWTRVFDNPGYGHWHSCGYHDALKRWVVTGGDGSNRMCKISDRAIPTDAAHWSNLYAGAPLMQAVSVVDFGHPTCVLCGNDIPSGGPYLLDLTDGTVTPMTFFGDRRSDADGYCFRVAYDVTSDMVIVCVRAGSSVRPKYPAVYLARAADLIAGNLGAWVHWFTLSRQIGSDVVALGYTAVRSGRSTITKALTSNATATTLAASLSVLSFGNGDLVTMPSTVYSLTGRLVEPASTNLYATAALADMEAESLDAGFMVTASPLVADPPDAQVGASVASTTADALHGDRSALVTANSSTASYLVTPGVTVSDSLKYSGRLYVKSAIATSEFADCSAYLAELRSDGSWYKLGDTIHAYSVLGFWTEVVLPTVSLTAGTTQVRIVVYLSKGVSIYVDCIQISANEDVSWSIGQRSPEADVSLLDCGAEWGERFFFTPTAYWTSLAGLAAGTVRTIRRWQVGSSACELQQVVAHADYTEAFKFQLVTLVNDAVVDTAVSVDQYPTVGLALWRFLFQVADDGTPSVTLACGLGDTTGTEGFARYETLTGAEPVTRLLETMVEARSGGVAGTMAGILGGQKHFEDAVTDGATLESRLTVL